MTKADLIAVLADKNEMSKRAVGELIDGLLDEIEGALRKGETVALIPFGSFEVRQRKRREGRNPKTGTRVEVPSKRIPYFKPSKELKDLVNASMVAAPDAAVPVTAPENPPQS